MKFRYTAIRRSGERNWTPCDGVMDAVQDWQGKQNTEHLQAVGLNPAIQLRDGEYIPTLAELYLICLLTARPLTPLCVSWVAKS